MNFRVAWHTTNFKSITFFYCDILGLEILGDFKNHNNYDGIFLGKKGLDWHLEFTISDEAPTHQTDEDDLLVFYVTDDEHITLEKRFTQNNILPVTPKNPYWQKNGLTRIMH